MKLSMTTVPLVVFVVFVVFVVLVIFAGLEAMRMGTHRCNLTGTLPIRHQPISSPKKTHCLVKRCLLIVIRRRVFKPDKIDSRDFELKTHQIVVNRQIAGRNAVHMGVMLAFQLCVCHTREGENCKRSRNETVSVHG